MASLKIIKASAGSGKTFTLTGEYLELLLNRNSGYFKHILAVTFTNKATAEMKNRILDELFILANNSPSKYLEYLQNKLSLSESFIRNKSKEILDHILHGYSWFRVETIDSFFQSVIRNFVRELNIPGYYKLELDQNKILDIAIDRFIDKLGENKTLVEWVLEYIEQKIEDGKSWRIKESLKSLGQSLFKESIIKNRNELTSVLEDGTKLRNLRDELSKNIKRFENSISKPAEDALKSIEKSGLENSDFYRGGSGTTSYFKKICNGEYELPTQSLQTVMDDNERWPSSKSKRKDEVIALGKSVLTPSAIEIINLLSHSSEDYFSARLILNNLHLLGLLTYLSSELTDIRREKGLFLISDTAPFISRIINNNDTPFIYEKTGNHFKHLLIDEFQDTSALQWENFKPLISNSLSFDNKCLLVGDVKQAIYRWRNSNWEILARQVNHDINKEYIAFDRLEINWRSEKNIIDFNNLFFPELVDTISSNTELSDEEKEFTREIYTGIKQHVPDFKKSEMAGYINIKFFEEEEKKGNPAYFGEELVSRINEMILNNYRPGDMAILVRSKKEGAQVTEYLIESNKKKRFLKDVGVISNESLFINQSTAVHLLLSSMELILNHDSSFAAAKTYVLYQQIFINDETKTYLPEGVFKSEKLSKLVDENYLPDLHDLKFEGIYNLAEKLIKLFNIDSLTEEKIYVHSFLDQVFKFTRDEESDLANFLRYWKEEGDKKTISSAESPDSIRVLTIHKSKGLEFPVVYIPFCNWDIKPSSLETLWIKPKKQPYNLLPVAPVKFSKHRNKSCFADDFKHEEFLTMIDNINLIYVAFTRAREALIISSILTKKSDGLGNMTESSLGHLFKENPKKILYQQDEKRYIFGQAHTGSTKEQHGEFTELTETSSSISFPMIRISSRTDRYQETDDLATYGSIMHAILEKVKTIDDLPYAVQQFVIEGIVEESQGDKILELLSDALKGVEDYKWFEPESEILTETEIISKSGKITRPDRVIINKHNVIVVDYKFGSSEETDKHIKQVNSYVASIKLMNYHQVTGYIWYISENKIVKTDE